MERAAPLPGRHLPARRARGRPGLPGGSACGVGRGIALGVALLSGLVGCAPVATPTPDPAPRPDAPPALLRSAPDAAGARWVEETLAGLTLREAVGQLVFPWISGAYAADDDPEFLETVEWVERDGIGGVVISIGTPHAYAAKLNALQRRARIPLLVTSDFENGGPGMRIAHLYALPTLLSAGGGTSFPPTMAFGAVGDTGLVERFGEATAREARAVGVHVVFAPVVDVNSNPENPIINTRAFGEDPETVGRMGAALIRGLQRGGTLATAKHFPGHGDTRVDSHLTLPEVEADRARLDRVELPPFRAAVAAGVDGVMTAHVAMPGVLGPGAPPATLAPEFMTGILREEMGFPGLLFTDALRMGAITERYGAGEAAVLAFEAGADVLVIPASVPGAVEAMVEAVESGRISRARLDASVRRILEAKARLELHRGAQVPVEGLSRVVGRMEHRALADEAAARSITLVRDRDGLLPPADPDGLRRVLSLTWAAPEDLVAGREFDAVLGGLLPGRVEAARVGPGATPGELEGLLARADAADLTLVNVYLPPRAGAGSVALPPAFRDFVAHLAAQGPTVLTSFGNPYLLTAVPEVGTYVVAWGDREVSQGAAARALSGLTGISGRLPISIPPLHGRGEGLERAPHPVMAEREIRRGDALDEAGLLRHEGDGVPEEEGRETGAPDPTDPPDAEDPEPVRPPTGSPGDPVPMAWRELSLSPLEVAPATVGMDTAALDRLDALIMEAIVDGVAPGVALAVGRGDRVVRLRGYGQTDWAPGSPPVTPVTLFDLASLTKVVGTTAAVMALVEEGRLGLEDPVVRHLPDFARGDPRKARVTIRDLLLHQSGFPAFRQFFLELQNGEEVRQAVFDLPLSRDPGSQMVYSDIGFKTLAWVVEAVSGEPFDGFLARAVFHPLGMDDTGFNPSPELRSRIAPTERAVDRNGGHVHGEVHDENAWTMGGVAGHAGLFSSAQDLAVFAALLAGEGLLPACAHQPAAGVPCARARNGAVRLFRPETVRAFARRGDPGGSRALGWDTPSGRSSAGDYFSAASFGHTGFTGTSIWIDPELDVWVVLLTNRVNPTRENTRHIPFRRDVHDAVARAVRDRPVELRTP
jgi:beta-N-acetylhexosaminidase